MIKDKDPQMIFQMGYESGYEHCNRDWMEEIESIKTEIQNKIDTYDDRNISEYEDCLAIIDRHIGEENG